MTSVLFWRLGNLLSLFRFMFLMMRQSHLIKHFKSRQEDLEVLRQLRIPKKNNMHTVFGVVLGI